MTFKDLILIPHGTKFHYQSARYFPTLFSKACVMRANVGLTNSKPYGHYTNKLLNMKKNRCLDQIRARKFEARYEGIETGAPTKDRGKGKLFSVERKSGECNQWKAKGQCTRGDACSFHHDENKRGEAMRPSSCSRTAEAKRWEKAKTTSLRHQLCDEQVLRQAAKLTTRCV